MNWEKFLENNWKKLFVFPIILLIFGLIVVGNNYYKTGDLFDRDVSLKGGISATVYISNVDIDNLKESLEDKLNTDIFTRELTDIATNSKIGVIIEIGETGISEELTKSIEETLNIKLNDENFSIEEVGSSLGESFYNDLIKAIAIAFLLMGVVVFITFRNFIPSTAVLLSAFIDILIPMAFVDLLGVKINTAGIAAFLMVIGYSVDTDILLTIKVLKRQEGGNVYQRIVDSAKTGLLMTITTIVALGAAYFVTTSIVLKQMFLIIIIALFTDVFTTYFMNSGILIWYMKRKEKGNEKTFWG